MATRMPLETARRLARQAVAAIDGDVWMLPDTSESLEPRFEWICVSLRVPHDAIGASLTHRRLRVARAIRESLSVLTLLEVCEGFELQENAAFWSDVLPCKPPHGSVPSWARGDWSKRRSRPRPCSRLRHPRFRFVASDHGATAVNDSAAYLLGVLEMLAGMAGLDQQAQTPAYDEALRELRPWVIRERLPEKTVCGVEVQDQDVARASKLLRARAAIAETATSTAREELLVAPPVCVERLFYSMQHCTKQHQALVELRHLVERRLPMQLEKVHLRIGGNRQRAPDQPTPDALRALLWAIHQHGSPELAQWRVELSNTSVVAAVCSALSSINSPRQLRISFIKDSDDSDGGSWSLKWKWLAAALFHPSTTYVVQHLSLENCRLTMGDIAAIETILNRDWNETMRALGAVGPEMAPDLVLPGNEAQGSCKCVFATLKHGARVETQPTKSFFGWPLETLSRQQSLRVLHANSNWVCIQMPGYGCGYVQRTSVLSFEERSLAQRKLRALSIEVDDADAAVALLRLVGGKLQHLALKCNTFQSSHLVSLLEYCHSLTSLRLSSTKLHDFSELIQAYAAGQCAITSLEVSTPRIADACIQLLCSTLSNREVAERSPLRELRLGTGRLRSHDLEELLRMLGANRTLRFLHVRIAFDLFAAFSPRFLSHRGDRVRDQNERDRTVAFLSAIGYYSASSSPMKSAGVATIALILSFAGADTRGVSVEENTDGMSLGQIAARTRL